MLTTASEIKELYEDENLAEAKAYLIGNGEALFQIPGLTFEGIQKKQPTWYAGNMVYGANRLIEAAKKGDYIYSLYTEEEIKQDSDKKDVRIFHFPAEQGDGRFALLLAGGGYGCVCSLEEAFPVAAKLNELGISAFCLNYRISKEITQEGLLPKPEEDIAAALRFIQEHAREMKIDPERYLLGGFSAGGHAAALWGTQMHGFRYYGMHAPELIMLAYPLVSGKNIKNFLQTDAVEGMLKGMFGKDYTQEVASHYYIDQNMDAAYPPVYVIQSEDDDTVPIRDSEDLVEALNCSQVRVVYEKLCSGGHGFGLGSNTSGKGWVERAVNFWDELTK